MSAARNQISWRPSATSSSSPSSTSPWLPVSFTSSSPRFGLPQGNGLDEQNRANTSFKWTCELCGDTLMDANLMLMHIASHRMISFHKDKRHKDESSQSASASTFKQPQQPVPQQESLMASNIRMHWAKLSNPHPELKQIKTEPNDSEDDPDGYFEDDQDNVHSVAESKPANPNQIVWKHQRVSPYNCRFCNATLSNNKALGCHIRISHKDLCPFYCKWPNCHFLSLKEKSMQWHIERKHSAVAADYIGTRVARDAPRQEWPCKLCGRKLNSGPGLQSHLVAHTKVGYRCTWSGCGFFFPGTNSAKIHVKTHYKDDPAFENRNPLDFLGRVNPKPKVNRLQKMVVKLTKSNLARPSNQAQVVKENSKQNTVPPPQLPAESVCPTEATKEKESRTGSSTQCSTAIRSFSFRPLNKTFFTRKSNKIDDNKIAQSEMESPPTEMCRIAHDNKHKQLSYRLVPNAAAQFGSVAEMEETFESEAQSTNRTSRVKTRPNALNEYVDSSLPASSSDADNDNYESTASDPTYGEPRRKKKRKRITIKSEPNSEEDDMAIEPSNQVTEESTFTCRVCAKPFNNSQNLNAHYRSVHYEHMPFYCTWPNCLYGSFRSYCTECHIRREHSIVGNASILVGTRTVLPNEKLNCCCYLCGRTMEGTYRLKRHIVSHTNCGYRCTFKDCGFFYPANAINARRHVELDHIRHDATFANRDPMDFLQFVEPNAYSAQKPTKSQYKPCTSSDINSDLNTNVQCSSFPSANESSDLHSASSTNYELFEPSNSVINKEIIVNDSYVDPLRQAIKRPLGENPQGVALSQTGTKRFKVVSSESPTLIKLESSLPQSQTATSTSNSTNCEGLQQRIKDSLVMAQSVAPSTNIDKSACPVAAPVQPSKSLIKRTDIITTVNSKNGSLSIYPVNEKFQVLPPSIRTNFSVSTVATFIKNKDNTKQLPKQQKITIRPVNSNIKKYNNSSNDLYAYKKPVPGPSKPNNEIRPTPQPSQANVVLGKPTYIYVSKASAAGSSTAKSGLVFKSITVPPNMVNSIVNNFRHNNKNIVINVSTRPTGSTPPLSSANEFESNGGDQPKEPSEQIKQSEPTQPIESAEPRELVEQAQPIAPIKSPELIELIELSDSSESSEPTEFAQQDNRQQSPENSPDIIIDLPSNDHKIMELEDNRDKINVASSSNSQIDNVNVDHDKVAEVAEVADNEMSNEVKDIQFEELEQAEQMEQFMEQVEDTQSSSAFLTTTLTNSLKFDDTTDDYVPVPSKPIQAKPTKRVRKPKSKEIRSTLSDLSNLQASPSTATNKQQNEIKTTEQQQQQHQEHDSHCFECHKKVTDCEDYRHCSLCPLTYHSNCIERAQLFNKQQLAIERYNALEQKPQESGDDAEEMNKLLTLPDMCDECVLKIVGKRFNRSKDGFDRMNGSYNVDVETTFHNIANLLINKVKQWKIWGYNKLINAEAPTKGKSISVHGEMIDLKTIETKAKKYKSIDEILFDVKMVIHQRHISSNHNKHVIHNCDLLWGQAIEEVRHIYLCDSCYRIYYKEDHKNLPKNFYQGPSTYGGVFLLGCQNPHTVVWLKIDEQWWPGKVFPNYTDCSFEIATDLVQVITFGPQTLKIVEPSSLYEYSSQVPENSKLETEVQQIAVEEADYYLTKQDSDFIDYTIPERPRPYERGNLYINTKPDAGQLPVAAQNDASGKKIKWKCNGCRKRLADRRLDSCTVSYCSEKCKTGFLLRRSSSKKK